MSKISFCPSLCVCVWCVHGVCGVVYVVYVCVVCVCNSFLPPLNSAQLPVPLPTSLCWFLWLEEGDFNFKSCLFKSCFYHRKHQVSKFKGNAMTSPIRLLPALTIYQLTSNLVSSPALPRPCPWVILKPRPIYTYFPQCL